MSEGYCCKEEVVISKTHCSANCIEFQALQEELCFVCHPACGSWILGVLTMEQSLATNRQSGMVVVLMVRWLTTNINTHPNQRNFQQLLYCTSKLYYCQVAVL
jgi:hypothetical protein